MIKLNYIIIFFCLIIKTLCAELKEDSPCTFQLTNSSGICKRLTSCPRLRDELINFNRLPQTCGFIETAPIVCCPEEIEPGAISKRKCKDYSVYGLESNGTDRCGHRIVKRIVGGIKASKKEFAHMALLGHEINAGNISWLCGATIISENYVVTAAHCQYSRTLGIITHVKVGITNLNDNDHSQEIKISEFKTNPDYKPQYAYNDIMLVKLAKPIEMNLYARPACLYTEEEISVKKAVATGWGKTDFLGGSSDDLLKVTLDLVDYETCNKTYALTRKLKNGIMKQSQMCAGQSGKDTCQGDAGGPLQIYHSGDDILCMYDIVGITSFGKSCGNSPGVYTKVSNYIKWIEDTVWPES